MGLKQDLTDKVRPIFKSSWSERDGQKVPEATDLKLDSNDAVKIDATVLYADLAGSTKLVDGYPWQTSAEVYKAFLHCASQIIRSENGVITAYDGDRVMGIFFEGNRNTNAARCALKIRWAVVNVVTPLFKEIYGNDPLVIKSIVGIDTSELRAARTGVRGSNDLVWVGRAANYAAKLSDMNDEGYYSYLTEDVYDRMRDEVKFGGSENKPMWEKKTWGQMNNKVIYRSSWNWSIS